MTVYEGVTYALGVVIATAGVAYKHGIGEAAMLLGALLIFVAVVGEWEAGQ